MTGYCISPFPFLIGLRKSILVPGDRRLLANISVESTLVNSYTTSVGAVSIQM